MSMKEWARVIAAGGATVTAYEEYANERIDELSRVCLDLNATEPQIRSAQAGIAEMRRLLNMREALLLQKGR